MKPPTMPRTQPRVADPAARLQAVWEAASDGLVLCDAYGVLLDVNPAYCQLTGYARADLVGQDCALPLPEADRPARYALYHEFFTTATPGTSFAVTLQRKDGSIQVMDVRISFLYAGSDGTASAHASVQPRRRVEMLTTIREAPVALAGTGLVPAVEAEIAEMNGVIDEAVQELRRLTRELR